MKYWHNIAGNLDEMQASIGPAAQCLSLQATNLKVRIVGAQAQRNKNMKGIDGPLALGSGELNLE